MTESVQHGNFEVLISGWTTSLEDWQRSLQAPASDLPELSPEEKEFARKFGVSEQDYARSNLSLEYGEKRMASRGRELGEAIGEILQALGPDYRLAALIYEATKLRWVARIESPQGTINIAVPRDLADDVIDSNTVQDRRRLKDLLLSNLDRSERPGGDRG